MTSLIKRYSLKHWRWYAGGLLALITTNYITALIPRKIEGAIDLIRAEGTLPLEVRAAVWTIVLLSLSLLLIRTISRLLLFFPGRFLEFDLRNDLFKKLIHFDPRFYRHHQIGDLMSRVINDIQSLRLLVGFGFLQALNTTFIFSFVLFQMIRIKASLAFFALLPFPLFLLLIRHFAKNFHRSISKNQSMLGSVTNFVTEAFNGIHVIKSFGAEKHLIKHFEKDNEAYRSTNLAVATLRARLFPLLAVMGSVANFVVFALGGRMVIQNTLTLGEFVAFGTYCALLAWPTAALGWMFDIFQRGKASWARVKDILDASTPTIAKNPTGSMAPLSAPPKIEVRHLTFGFPGTETPVLKDLSFSISPGAKVGIFGPTGSGKSVLANLLARMEPSPRGTLLLNNVDFDKWPLDLFRNAMSYVPQNNFLFSEPIKDNIAYSENSNGKSPSMEKVQQAAQAACVEADILKFPQTFDTVVGERGIILSGGQKNRMALARALYKPHVFLILDDILSAVDHKTEKELCDHIFSSHIPRTTVIISHRISALTKCDHILVLEHGHLTDEGDHTTLSQRAGIYRDTWLYQRAVESQ